MDTSEAEQSNYCYCKNILAEMFSKITLEVIKVKAVQTLCSQYAATVVFSYFCLSLRFRYPNIHSKRECVSSYIKKRCAVVVFFCALNAVCLRPVVLQQMLLTSYDQHPT